MAVKRKNRNVLVHAQPESWVSAENERQNVAVTADVDGGHVPYDGRPDRD